MAQRPIDLRSDTVTQPTAAMRQAMAEAEVGDDVYGEDPSVARLEQACARLVGKEAALFVPTGTMGNQCAIAVHSRRGGQMLLEENSHIALYEGGGASLLWGVTLRLLRGTNGTFTGEDVRRNLPPDDPHFAQVRLVALENTHNFAGGRCWSRPALKEVAAVAHANNAKVHLDGARIFNAALATRTDVEDLCKPADSVMFCLSKGLGAPVGSVLCGPRPFIEAAHAVRKTLGGGMRQAGHMAAAGLVAIEEGIPRLAEDHANARRLAEGLAQLPGVAVDLATVETNMVVADVSNTGLTGAQYVAKARAAGVLCLTLDSGPRVRFVTHKDVGAADMDEAVRRLSRLRVKA